MTALEQQLVALGRELDAPETPDLAGAIRRRLAEPERGRWPRRKTLALAFAVVAVAIGIAFAVPPARSSLLRFFGVGAVRIERVEQLPAVPPGGKLVLGNRVTLAEARRRAGFDVGVPTAAGFERPNSVYFSIDAPGGVVSLLYGTPVKPRALLTELESRRVFIEKTVGPGTSVETVRVNGSTGYRLTGKPHVFTFENTRGRIQSGAYRLATTTLVWRRGRVTYRLEGELSKATAVAVAGSVR